MKLPDHVTASMYEELISRIRWWQNETRHYSNDGYRLADMEELIPEIITALELLNGVKTR